VGRFIAIIAAPVGKVRANGRAMPLRLGSAAFLAAILTISLPARAQDGGEGGTNGDSAGSATDDASPDADVPTVIACDGALCASDSGTRCSITSSAAGTAGNDGVWVAMSVAVAVTLTRRSKHGTRCP
jgi:hypothetical protein